MVGSVNLDLVARVSRLPDAGETIGGAVLQRFPGGKGANQALAAALLGAEVDLIAAVGADENAERALALLRAGGVGLSGVRTRSAPTGLALITVDDAGDTTIVVVPGANGELALDDRTVEQVRVADAVICQLEVPLAVVSQAARIAEGFFCLNTAPAKPVPPELIARADLVVANQREYQNVPGLDAARLLALTRGAEGAELLRTGERVAVAEGVPVEAVDGTAAGDCFVAALVVGLGSGLDAQAALRRACVAGAITATRRGAQPSLPTAEEVDAWSDGRRP